jgi:glycosyl hydrolase family 97
MHRKILLGILLVFIACNSFAKEYNVISPDGKVLGENEKIKKVKRSQLYEIIKPVIANKKSEVLDNCNILTISTSSGLSVQFRAYDEAVALYENWGVKGVKVDFIQRDDQKIVNFYIGAIKKCAEHHLLIDFHGAYKPDGIGRTWPNALTREGVKGMENIQWISLRMVLMPISMPVIISIKRLM